MQEPFYLQKNNIYIVPITHYNMEMASYVRLGFLHIQPDCVAVELPETMQKQMLQAASRLPDLSVIKTADNTGHPLYFMCEPCEPTFEALRSALEMGKDAYCIDLDVDQYPQFFDLVPDEYAVKKLGLKFFYEQYERHDSHPSEFDTLREYYMARRLKELSLRHDKVLFVTGMAHAQRILYLLDKQKFVSATPVTRPYIELYTLTERSTREVMHEYGWISRHYELAREFSAFEEFPPDRQKLIFQLYRQSGQAYKEQTGHSFAGYHLRNLMKFVRNYALIKNRLMPDLFQLLTSAKGCVDHNFAYETWKLATDYPFRKNIDNLPELDLSVQEIWGASKHLRFELKSPSRKALHFQKRKDSSQIKFKPPSPFSICSYPPEDVAIERFGKFLKKKAAQILTDETSRSIPFSTSIEDGIDTKETIRHWHEKKLFVKVKGKPPKGIGSVVVIFDEDLQKDNIARTPKFPWCTSWIGEHNQESDMAFYATDMNQHVVGPGISRCEYGGFMMSYPPRRLFNIWADSDYQMCQSKSEVLLMAAIDYSLQTNVVYIASRPPRSIMKSFASLFGKKIIYVPLSQVSPLTLNKLRVFHVLDGHDKRFIADEYIF